MAKHPRLANLWLDVPALFPHVISSTFDAPRNYGFASNRVQRHEGIDLAPYPRPAKGQVLFKYPIGASYSGVVDRRGELTATLGNYVVLAHEFDNVMFFTWYCHLDHFTVKSGQKVSPREVIGYAGWSGNVEPKDERGTHLHFVLAVPFLGRKNYVIADVLDPLPYLVAG